MADRVRITSSRRRTSPSRTRASTAPTEQPGLGEVYLRGLMRAQLRLSISVLLVGVILLGGLPVVFALIPQLRLIAFGGIPLPWLILGIGVYPAAVAVSRFYIRASERIERQFRDVTRSGRNLDD